MKKFFKRILRKFGYEVKLIESIPETLNPFKQQQLLLSNKNNILIFDIGAHHGVTTKTYKRLFPESIIYSFEPDPESFSILNKEYKDFDNIYPFQIALSDFDGVGKLNINEFSPANSLLESDSRSIDYWVDNIYNTKKSIEVTTRSLDSFCNEHNISKINILKIDVQGSELAVLRGASQLLSKHAIGLIYTEVILVPTYQNQTLFHELNGFLYNYGYDLFGIYSLKHYKSRLVQFDSIFIQKDTYS